MASGRGEGTYNHGEHHLQSSQNGARQHKKMCVCVHVQGFAFLIHVCNRLYTPSSLQFGYLLSRVYNGLYPVFLQLGAHHPHRVHICVHDQSKLKMKIETLKPIHNSIFILQLWSITYADQTLDTLCSLSAFTCSKSPCEDKKQVWEIDIIIMKSPKDLALINQNGRHFLHPFSPTLQVLQFLKFSFDNKHKKIQFNIEQQVYSYQF